MLNSLKRNYNLKACKWETMLVEKEPSESTKLHIKQGKENCQEEFVMHTQKQQKHVCAPST